MRRGVGPVGTDCLEVHSIARIGQLLSTVVTAIYVEQRKKSVVDDAGRIEM